MDNSRLRILEYFQSREVASAVEISRVLHTTTANARHHLSILAEEGVIQVLGVRKEARRGRPVNVYCLSERIARNNLANLAHILLENMMEKTPPGQAPQALNGLARKLVPVTPQPARNPTLRISETITRLKELNYQARWEAHAQAPRLIFQHCPYAAILPDHPELCQLDVQILENLLGASVSLTGRLVPSDQGFNQCVFQMGRKNPST